MTTTCDRCHGTGHTRAECTPPPCPDCGGVEAHRTEACPSWRRMAYSRSPR